MFHSSSSSKAPVTPKQSDKPSSGDSSAFPNDPAEDGYASFFDNSPPIPSYTSWSTKQVTTLQMLMVAPLASQKIEEFSKVFPVFTPRSVGRRSEDRVAVGDGFWYIDPETSAEFPHM